MHIVTLPNKEHYEYLMFVFHKHAGSGLDPEELAIAGQVWSFLKNSREILPPAQEKGEPETIQIPGPLQIVHEGDVSMPSNEVGRSERGQ
jgi:hypothetical protein